MLDKYGCPGTRYEAGAYRAVGHVQRLSQSSADGENGEYGRCAIAWTTGFWYRSRLVRTRVPGLWIWLSRCSRTLALFTRGSTGHPGNVDTGRGCVRGLILSCERR